MSISVPSELPVGRRPRFLALAAAIAVVVLAAGAVVKMRRAHGQASDSLPAIRLGQSRAEVQEALGAPSRTLGDMVVYDRFTVADVAGVLHVFFDPRDGRADIISLSWRRPCSAGRAAFADVRSVEAAVTQRSHEPTTGNIEVYGAFDADSLDLPSLLAAGRVWVDARWKGTGEFVHAYRIKDANEIEVTYCDATPDAPMPRVTPR